MSNVDSDIIKIGIKTLALTGLGTAALVGAHHLGRKQYDSNASLLDYVEGVKRKLGLNNEVKPQEAQKSKRGAQSVASPLSQQTVSNPDNLSAPYWISGVADVETNEFAVVAIDDARQIIWQTTMPERVHDILIQPKPKTHMAEVSSSQSPRHVAVMGRRPSEHFWILDVQTGEVIYSISAQKDRHFYGHACYSVAGDLLYVTENNTTDFSGVIGVYDVQSGYQKIDEFKTQGIGPHELLMHTDGETLVIANGGIKTERASREELNLDSMQPSLVYLKRHNGELLEQVYPEHNQMSVRHLAMHDDGTVIVAIQFQGERHLSVPMVLTHRRGEAELTSLQIPTTDNKGWYRFHHYIASVAVDSDANLICGTSPIGGCAAIFDLNTRQLVDATDLPDCAGVAGYDMNTDETADKNTPRFLVTNGQGYLTQLAIGEEDSSRIIVDKIHQPYAFDNHLNTVVS